MREYNESVGYKISVIRNNLNMTQEEFAQKIVNKPGKRLSGMVGNWEQGRNLPNKARLVKIAKLGNMTVEELLGKKSNVVGERIKGIRKELGLNMEEFGKELDTSKGGVNNWEKGINLPNNERLKRIAKLGNLTVAELLEQKTVDDITQEIKSSFNDDEIKQIIRNLI